MAYAIDAGFTVIKEKTFMEKVIDGYNKTVFYNENPSQVDKVKETYKPPKGSNNSSSSGGIGLAIALAILLVILNIRR